MEQNKEELTPESADETAEKTAEETVADESQQPTENQETSIEHDVERLLAAIAEKNRLHEELIDRYKRLQADFDNFRRRTRQEKEELSAVVTQEIVAKLLPVLDNFERALASGATQDAAALFSGIEMIYRQFSSIFEKIGVKPIEAVGATFDPQLHEAVMRVVDADKPEGLIVDEFQKGYMACGKVIRPSMVRVVSHN